MKVKVVGIRNVDFVGKDGRNVRYRELQCVCLDPRRYVEGNVVVQEKLFPEFDSVPITVGSSYNFSYGAGSNGKAFLDGIEPIK